MALEKKHWYWIGGLAATAVVGYVVYTQVKKAKDRKQAELDKQALKAIESSTMTKDIPSAPAKIEKFPLQKGSRGYEVRVVQRYMNSQCKSQLSAAEVFPLLSDGIWGNKTQTGTSVCDVIKTEAIDKKQYDRIYRDMKAANILPK